MVWKKVSNHDIYKWGYGKPTSSNMLSSSRVAGEGGLAFIVRWTGDVSVDRLLCGPSDSSNGMGFKLCLRIIAE